MSGINQPYRYPYVHCAAGSSQTLGTGAKGDYLHRLIVTVTTAATSAVTLSDGAGAHNVLPANTPIGVYQIDHEIKSASGGWSVTCGAGAEAIAVGLFTP